MDALTSTKNELISVLQENKFDHLTRKEQIRMRDYLEQIVITLHEASDLRRIRRIKQLCEA